MFDPYKPQDLMLNAMKDMFVVETAIELAALIKLFKAKGFVAECELQPFRKELHEDPKYKDIYENAKAAFEAGKLYKQDPSAYLTALMTAKMSGKI